MRCFNAKCTLLLLGIGFMNNSMDKPAPNSLHKKIKSSELCLDRGSCDTRKLLWSPDGKYIAGSSYNYTPFLSVWNADGTLCWNSNSPQFTGLDFRLPIAFSTDGKCVAIVGLGERSLPGYAVAAFRTADGKKKMLSRNIKGEITCLAYNNDNTKIAAGTGYHGVWGIDIKTGEILQLGKRYNGITTLAYTPDGTQIAIGFNRYCSDGDNNIILLDAITGDAMTSLGHPESIHTLRFYHNDSSKFITCSSNHCLLWDLITCITTHIYNKDNDHTSFSDVVLSSDNKKLMIARALWSSQKKEPYFVTMFDIDTGEKIGEFGKDSVWALACSPDWKKMVLARPHSYAYMFTLPSNEEIKSLQLSAQ